MTSSTIITLVANDGEYRTALDSVNKVDYFKNILEHAEDKKRIFVDFSMKEIKFIMRIVKYSILPKYSKYLKYKHILDYCCIKVIYDV